jgi:hypothetical protein
MAGGVPLHLLLLIATAALATAAHSTQVQHPSVTCFVQRTMVYCPQKSKYIHMKYIN